MSVGRNIEFYTLAPVPAGEPLCISYLDPREDRVERRTHLQNGYGFTCQCSRCQGNAPLPELCPKHLGYIVGGAGGSPWCTACSRK
mmetsp:Transcript_21148/g.60433  ORF Transcript_21148/g.60433 Transcript_21148/m.60433 type:complete len:86 (-) Transcript_21148:96-353(-)